MINNDQTHFEQDILSYRILQRFRGYSQLKDLAGNVSFIETLFTVDETKPKVAVWQNGFGKQTSLLGSLAECLREANITSNIKD